MAPPQTPRPQFDVGTSLPPIRRGPLSPMHLVRWSAAIENWHRIHYDWRFATGHDGLRDLPVNGSLKQHFLVQLVRNWMNGHGWLVELGYRFEKPDMVWDVLTATGTVTGKQQIGSVVLAECRLEMRNQRDELSTSGSAKVIFPAADGDVLPYPLEPGFLAGLGAG